MRTLRIELHDISAVPRDGRDKIVSSVLERVDGSRHVQRIHRLGFSHTTGKGPADDVPAAANADSPPPPPMMGGPQGSIPPKTVGDILSAAFNIYKANASQLILVVAVVVIPLSLIAALFAGVVFAPLERIRVTDAGGGRADSCRAASVSRPPRGDRRLDRGAHLGHPAGCHPARRHAGHDR